MTPPPPLVTPPPPHVAPPLPRRNSILIVNALSVVGACLMFSSKASESFEVLIVGRLVFGLFCGLVMSLNPLYIQEVSPTNLRGAFATLNQVSFATGILLGMVSPTLTETYGEMVHLVFLKCFLFDSTCH